MVAPLRIATRGSVLARWQAERVAALLGVDAELVIVSTKGDERRDVEIHRLGGQGVFVKEVEQAVLDGRADLAVHSAKDLPSTTEAGLVLAAVPERADPRDALVGCSLDGLPTGGRVATGSVRRRAQLASLRPDLQFTGLRGNLDTRLARVHDRDDPVDAVVVAAAALDRLGRADEAAEVLEPEVLLPQVAQGALAVECRADDETTHKILAAIDDATVHRCVRAERAFLAELGGGCDLPVGALAHIDDGELALRVLLASLDGVRVVRAHARGTEPEATGRAAAVALLDGAGGRALLDEEAIA
ncbi:MAG TPA: hydroxymethylbilane synthase [Acidimicrobiia bacterium]|jgi:hydroxymethylbilane synthase|nr:hydroxymethylbilane synthase [Acidimicrobiia bacterium]